MCTITLHKLASGQWSLSQNRDESRERPVAQKPEWRGADQLWLYPVDSQAQGTWMMAHREQPRQYCLFNGAATKHQHRPPYRHSRGQILLDLSNFGTADEYFGQADLSGIEPFSVLGVEDGRATLYRYDGQQLSRESLSQEPQIFCSSTLYTPEQQEIRKNYYDNFGIKDWTDVLDFHQSRVPLYAKEGIAIDREIVKTVNVFSLLLDENFVFEDFKYIEL